MTTARKLATLGAVWAARDLYNAGKRLAVSKIMPYKRRRMAYAPRRRYKRVRYYKRRRKTGLRSKYYKRKLIGFRPGSGTCKRTLVYNDQLSFNTRTLYSRDLTWIQHTDTAGNFDVIDRRQRDQINIRGFAINMAIHNQEPAWPMYVNVAIISPRYENLTNFGGGQDNAIPTGEFFRGNGTERTINFQNGLTPLQFRCLNINTDTYVVLKHKRYMLANRNTALANTNSGDAKAIKMVDWYVRLNRQIRFDNYTVPARQGRVFLVWWCDTFDATGGSAAQTALLDVQFHIVTHWREPRC